MRSVVRPRSGHTVSPRHALTATLAAGLVLGLAACSGLEPSAPTTGGSGDASGEAAASVDELAIVVPADPGGGWDQTGRAMQQDLQGSGLVRTATVTNVGGAGGTVGLASLANTTDPHTLLVMGLVMVGAVETNESQARIEDTTPIARLTEEPLVVVVPASSPYQTLEDLVDDRGVRELRDDDDHDRHHRHGRGGDRHALARPALADRTHDRADHQSGAQQQAKTQRKISNQVCNHANPSFFCIFSISHGMQKR